MKLLRVRCGKAAHEPYTLDDALAEYAKLQTQSQQIKEQRKSEGASWKCFDCCEVQEKLVIRSPSSCAG